MGDGHSMIEIIAAVAHEANRAYCQQIGDYSQVMWGSAPGWQRQSVIEGVKGIIEGRITRPEQSHESWMAQKVADGWIRGNDKDPVAKTHPCLVPFHQLPIHQQLKDHLFFGVVKALTAIP